VPFAFGLKEISSCLSLTHLHSFGFIVPAQLQRVAGVSSNRPAETGTCRRLPDHAH